jgi:ribonucleoside-diphosphate reductase alpha chain
MDTYKARDLMRKIAEGTFVCGDPGMQFDTTINDWHTCKKTDRIHASNPCSEYMFLNDSACNLASLNLMKFRDENGELDIDAFRHAVPHHDPDAMEIIVDNSSYPRGDRGQQPPVPSPGPGLRQPGRAADVPRPALRQRPGSGLRRRASPRSCVARPISPVAEIAQPDRDLRRATAENREPMLEVVRKHRAAVNNINAQPGARAAAGRGGRLSGARPTSWATTTATATARSRSWRPPAPSAS